MIMRIVWGKTKPGGWSEFERKYREVVVAKTRNIKGLQGRFLAQDEEDQDAGFAISLWDDPGDLDAYVSSPVFEEIQSQLGDVFIGEFWMKHCHVNIATQG